MRRTKLNQELINKLADMVIKGVTIAGCCAALNIGESTYYDWMQEGERLLEHPENINEKNQIKVDLVEAIKNAEGLFEENCLKLIEVAAIKDWKAAAWLLERRRRKDYALQRTEDNSQDNQVQIVFDVPKRDVKRIEKKS